MHAVSVADSAKIAASASDAAPRRFIVKSLSDWLAYLESLHPKGQGGIELGLDRVGCVKAQLGQTPRCPVVIVGGTNGKGSTCAYLEAIYTRAGYRVGCYTSPHLFAYGERVRVNRCSVDDESLCSAFASVESARRSAGNVFLTYFEFGTLAAWEVFAAQNVDVMILEVGLGGRLDAVNAYDADCAIVTGIALDHTDWLGETRETIGFEKAGIFRAGRPAICADPEPPQSLLEHARSIGATLQRIGIDFDAVADGETWSFRCRGMETVHGLAKPVLAGAFQLRNASAAMAAVVALQERLPVKASVLPRSFTDIRLPGRFQVISGPPDRIFDVAHNPQAVAGLAENLATLSHGGRIIAVVGMLADKDIEGALRELAGRVDVWLFATLDVPRGAPADVLMAAHREARLGGIAERFASPVEAMAHAAKLAGEDDKILVFGSFYTVSACLREARNGN